MEKNAQPGMGIVMRTIAGGLLTVPISYYAAGTVDEKTIKGIPISKTEDFVRKHPMLVALGTAMVGASAYKSLGKQIGKLKLRTKMADVGAITKLSHFVNRLDELTFNKVYEDLILN